MRPRVLCGQLNFTLNSNGVKQAKSLAQRLSKKTFDYIYTSDSLQCVSTAQEIKQFHPNSIVLEEKRLREMDVGAFAGSNWVHVKKQLTSMQTHFDDYLEQQAESMDKFNQRVIEFYSELIHNHLLERHELNVEKLKNQLSDVNQFSSKSDKNCTGSSGTSTPNRMRMDNMEILIVTHGGWIDSLFKHLINDLHFTVPDTILTQAFPKIAGLYQFQISKVIQDMKDDYEWKGEIKVMNSVSHLAATRNVQIIAKTTPLNQGTKESPKSSPDVTPESTPPTSRKSYLRLLGIGKDKKQNFFKTSPANKSDPLGSPQLQKTFGASSPKTGSPRPASPSSYRMSPSRGSPKLRVKSLGW